MASRNRGFACVLYPESAPDNWRSVIDDLHVKWAESPLHDQDKNDDGTPKKPHWHIVLSFDSVKSLDQVNKMLEPLHCPTAIPLNSVKGYIRYFCHLDNPEKFQYPVSGIIGHGGIDIADLLRISASEKYKCIKDMMAFCSTHHIIEFCDLVDYASRERFDDWFPLLCDSCSFIMSNYLKSLRNRVWKDVEQ